MKSAGGIVIPLTHKGSRIIKTTDGSLTLRETYYAEGGEYNLISVTRLAEKGAEAKLTHHAAHIQKGETRIHLEKQDGLWSIPEIRVGMAASLRMERGGATDGLNWHCRLGHPSKKQTKGIVVQGIAPRQAYEHAQDGCSICMTTHPGRRPIPKVAERSRERTVQVDFMPVGHKERGWKDEVGAYIFADRTSKINVYPVKTATAEDALTALDNYLTMIVPYLKGGITCIQTDAGSQFGTKGWAQRCAADGIKWRMCPVAHQAMNGQVERSQGTLATKTRALLKDKNTPFKFWPLELEAAAYVLNRTPHTALNGKTPIQVGTGDKQNLMHTKVFGCKAYVQIPKEKREGKLTDTAWQVIMVGYSTNSPEWLILDADTGVIRKAYSVKFQE